VNYTFRMHDPRVGRFFEVDPLASKYPYNGTYNFSENRVLDGVELEGLEYKEIDKDGNVIVHSKIAIVTEGEFAVKNYEYVARVFSMVPIVYNSNEGIRYFQIFGQEVNAVDAGISLVENREPSRIQKIEFQFELIAKEGVTQRQAMEIVTGWDDVTGEIDLGTTIKMAKPGELSDNVPGEYNGITFKLNPKYFEVGGEFYGLYPEVVLINTLTHEIGHDLKLEHLDDQGNKSNKSEDYPNVGIMSKAGSNQNQITEEELIEINDKTKIKND
jgi:hypothetical protein